MNDKDEMLVPCDYVVCLLDLQGTKDKLAKWTRSPGDWQETPELMKAVHDSVDPLRSFEKDFIERFNGFTQSMTPDEFNALTNKDKEVYQRSNTPSVRVERFSDTFVFSSPLVNDHGDVPVKPICDILVTCCLAMLQSLAKGTPLRGAVCVGGGIWLNGSFYGPALAEAHYFESKVAGYPRVIVSPTVLKLLAGGDFSQDREVDGVMRDLAGDCRSLVWRDVEDGYWIVDFLGPGARRKFNRTGSEVFHPVKRAYDFVRNAAVRFQCSNTKLARRYYQLQQYIEPRLHLWGIQP